MKYYYIGIILIIAILYICGYNSHNTEKFATAFPISRRPINTITAGLLNTFRNEYSKDNIHSLLENSISANNVGSLFLERNIAQKYNYIFSKKIKVKKDITNQRNSGRCWLFSFTNILNSDLIDTYNLPKNFTLSNTHLFFYDKLEKCNYFIDNVLNSLDKKFDSRLVRFLIKDPITDGGNWHMAINLIKKYGILPESNMRESRQSSNSRYLNYFLKDNMMIYMKQIRQAYSKLGNKIYAKKTILKLKSDILGHIYKILCYFLGKPVTEFDWSYYDSNKNYKIVKNLTPLKFYHNVMSFEPKDYVICINYPLKQYPFNKVYNIKYCNNMTNGQNTDMLNLPIEKIIKYSARSIDNSEGVWFGCDVGKYKYAKAGILDTEVYNFNRLYNSNSLTKAESVLYNQSGATHAMVFSGYDRDKNNQITKWLVENSWGDEYGDKDNEGYLRMSNNWFKKYVYSIVVKRKYLDRNIANIFNNVNNYVDVEPWSYMGCDALK